MWVVLEVLVLVLGQCGVVRLVLVELLPIEVEGMIFKFCAEINITCRTLNKNITLQ